MRIWTIGLSAVALLGFAAFSPAAVQYSIDDGTSENALGLGTSSFYDIVWLNTFTKIPGAEKIVSIDVIFGTPRFPGGATNGTPIKVLLYDDADGGEPWNGVLRASVAGVVANADTNNFAVYNIPGGADILSNNFAVGVLMPHTVPSVNPFPAGFDETDPDLPGRSWVGFGTLGTTIDENNLGAIPFGFRGTSDDFGAHGNWMIRADGVSIPEPASLTLFGMMIVASSAHYGRRRGRTSQSTYAVDH